MTVWSIIVELDIPDELLDQAKRAVVNAVRFETGATPTTRTIQAAALNAALGYRPVRDAA